MNLSIRHLKAFSALASVQNFTRAAELCNLTQSAFSALISNLEAGLSVKLFVRNTRNVELTAEGKVFSNIVERLLPEMQGGLAEMQDYAQRRKGRVSIAALPSISTAILPKFIAKFSSAYPGIEIIIQDVAHTTCVELVRTRQVDFALCAAMSASTDLDIEKLASDDFYFVCTKSHPLAARPVVSAEDILPMPIIAFERNSSIRQHLDASVYPKKWSHSFEVNSLSTAVGFVCGGLGVTIVPTLGLFPFNNRGLRIIPVSLPINDRDICLIQHNDSSNSVAAQAFISLVRENFALSMHALAPVRRAALGLGD